MCLKIGTLLKQMELCLLRRGYRHEEGLKWEFLFIPARLLGRARLLIFKIFPPGTIILQARLLSSTEYGAEKNPYLHTYFHFLLPF